ncbi:MAG: hypothetical protein M3220_18145 [Chloroflexota bacterium]|nr:hypothetical protein [Chloroflexota bacterium]
MMADEVRRWRREPLNEAVREKAYFCGEEDSRLKLDPEEEPPLGLDPEIEARAVECLKRRRQHERATHN